jgi:hypothetical protein
MEEETIFVKGGEQMKGTRDEKRKCVIIRDNNQIQYC